MILSFVDSYIEFVHPLIQGNNKCRLFVVRNVLLLVSEVKKVHVHYEDATDHQMNLTRVRSSLYKAN